MATKKKNSKKLTMEVLSIDEHITAEAERPWWNQFVHKMVKISPDEWPVPVKRTKKTRGHTTTYTVTIEPAVKIADMHPAKLANTIMWCIKMVQKEMTANLWRHMGTTKAELLAELPQWPTLLAEGRRKHVFAITKSFCPVCHVDWATRSCDHVPEPEQCLDWYKECVRVLGLKILED